jgi:hypothetical protein
VRQVREGKGTKGSERVVGKAAGDECDFIPGEGPDWQMRSGPDAIPDTAGGEVVTGPHGVIHRYPYTHGPKVMSSNAGLVLLRAAPW